MNLYTDENDTIYKHEDLIHSKMNIDITGMRIFELTLAKMNQRDIESVHSEHSIHAKEYSEMFGDVDPYRTLKRAVKKLGEHSIELKGEKHQIFSRADYMESKGKLVVQINQDIDYLIHYASGVEHVSNLKEALRNIFC